MNHDFNETKEDVKVAAQGVKDSYASTKQSVSTFFEKEGFLGAIFLVLTVICAIAATVAIPAFAHYLTGWVKGLYGVASVGWGFSASFVVLALLLSGAAFAGEGKLSSGACAFLSGVSFAMADVGIFWPILCNFIPALLFIFGLTEKAMVIIGRVFEKTADFLEKKPGE